MSDKNKQAPTSSVLDEFDKMKKEAMDAPTLSPQEIMADIIAKARREKRTNELLGKFDGLMNMLAQYVNTNIAQRNANLGMNVDLSVETDISDALEDKGPVRFAMTVDSYRSEQPKEPENIIASDNIVIVPVDE